MRQFLKWLRQLPVPPDPWDAEVAESLESPDVSPVCHKCSQPQPQGQTFCEHCGCAVGDYNNCMPYVYLFSEGEVLRTGSGGKFRVNAVTIAGFLLYSLTCYLIFAPVYWYLLYKNIRRIERDEMSDTTGV